MIRHIKLIKLMSLCSFALAVSAYSPNASARIIDLITCNLPASSGMFGKYTVWCANPSGRTCDFSIEKATAICAPYGGLHGRWHYDDGEEVYAGSAVQKAYCEQLLLSKSPAFMSNPACVALTGGLKKLDMPLNTTSPLLKPQTTALPSLTTPKASSTLLQLK